MTEQIQNSDIDQLSETVKSLQKSLECTICLQLMTEPAKTRCGHSFCKLCIGKVLRKKNASCPLCKKNLNRRNVSKDDHLETCITKFTNLVTAIQVDSNIDILSHSKPRDTKESNISNLPDHSFPANENDNAIFSRPDIKVRTWLQHLPDEESSIEISANLISDNNNKLNATDEIHDNKYNKSNKTNRHRKQIDYKDCMDENTNTSRISKDTDAKQFDKVLKTNSAASNELKYKAIHDRIRAKNSKEFASKSDIEKTNNRNNSLSIIANDQTHQLNDSNSNASAAQSSFADWTRIIEFGKETKRGKKRKMKKLNINTEKNKDAPRIIENISLSSSKKYDLAKIAMDHNMSRKEENSKKQDAFDKNLDSSNAEMMPLEVSSEAYIYNSKECIKTNSSILSPTNHPIKTLHVTLEAENKQIPIINLTSSQVNEIIGSENINKNSHRCREERVEIITEHCNSLLSSPKKLAVLTPEKLNESIREHEMMRDIAQTPASNFRNSSLAENRTPEPEWNKSPQRTLGEVASSQSPQTPKSNARLSLKRKPGISDNKKINSPLLSQVPLIDRLSSNEKDIDDHKNINSPVSKNGKLFDRLTAVKRDLNLQIIGEDQLQTNRNTIHSDALLKKQTDGNVSRMICQVEKFVSNLTTLGKSEIIKNQECLVKFRQMGTMIKRRNVRYFYLGPTKREQSLPAQMQITSVYNMQQSISKFEMESYITNMSYNLARSSDRSNESQDMMDITVIENIRSRAVSKDIELSMASPKVSATSMLKKDIDHYLNRKKIATIEENAQSLHKTTPNSSAIQKSSRIHSGTSNSIKMLSPDKDSQLKFLTIDSPMSDHEKSKRANLSWQQSELEKSIHIKENNFSKMKNSRFAASTSKAQEPSIENSNKKRKRMRDSSDKELFDDGRNDNSSDSASDSDRRKIKLGRYSKSSKNIELDSDASKKYRSSSPDDQNLNEVISSNSKKQNTCTRKFRRILSISNSDTESESVEHIARNCKRPRADDKSEQRNALIMNAPKEKCLSIRFPSEKKLINSRSANHQKGESQNSLTMRESDMFESSSIFNSDNVDYILQQSGNKISEKIAEASNDDIINKVLQIDRLQSNTNACRSLDSTLRNNRMSQKEKNSKEYLLQDNFDEIIANVELLQNSEDAIPTNQSISRNLKSCPSVKQRMSNCLAMTDELYGAVQETPILSASSTHDIFESCPFKNVKRSTTPAILENFGKENIVSHGQKKHDCTVDQKEKRNVTINTDTIEENPCRRITSKHNVAQEREKFFDESSLAQHINVSINQSINRSHVDDRTMQRPIVAGDELNLTTDNLFDSLMNITQHQCQLQKFEEELLGITVNQNHRTTITLQKDSTQEQQHTPEKRKKDTQDKKTTAEVLSADEDDVVEKTPERKMKNNGNNISWKQLELRKNISPISKPHTSPVEQMPSISKTKTVSKSSASTPVKLLEIYPLYQSTPQSSTTNKLKNMRQQFDKQKLCFICSGLTATQLATVKKFATKHNVDYVNQFESDVTHVIVNTIGEKNAAKSTLKFLQGIAHRKWIVSYRWIEDCIKQEKLLNEATYEATTFTDGIIDDGPQRSRLRKKNLFEDFTFWCVGPYLNVSLNQYQNLLLATGATVVDSLEALAKKEGMKGIVIQDGVHDDKEIEHWYRTAKAAPISDGWIVDCIGNYKLFNLAPYIQHLSLQDLCAIGFPQELIGDEEYSDDEE
ncbi:hypothetical protein ACFW04_006779 [Cataglyphis niger]